MEWHMALLSLAIVGCGRIGFDEREPAPRARSILTVTNPTSEELVDFPLLVVLDEARIDRTILKPDASDLRFFGPGGEPLVYEVDQLGPPLVVWVRVPLLGVGPPTLLSVSYGDPATPAASGSVWSDAYAGVWHLGEHGGGDATGNGHHGRAIGAAGAPTVQVGMAGTASSFDGTQAFEIDDHPALGFDSGATISGWINLRSPARDALAGVLTRAFALTEDNDLYLAMQDSDTITGIRVAIRTENGNVGFSTAPPTGLPHDQWIYLALRVGLDALSAHFVDGDGNLNSISTGLSGRLVHSANPLYLGANCNLPSPEPCPNADFVYGLLDEVRLERVERSVEWLRADIASMADHMIDYGPVLLD